MARGLQVLPVQERATKPPRFTPEEHSTGVWKGRASDAANVSARGAEPGTRTRARQRSLLPSEMWG